MNLESVSSSGESVVLVVDDNESLSEAFREELDRVGYIAIAASSKEEANEKIDHNRIHAAVVDLNLIGGHDRQGLEVIRHLREASPDAKVLLISSTNSERLARAGREVGANWTGCKPLDGDRLAAALHALDISAE